MDIETTIRLITVYAIPVIFAITLHEAAHGYVAKRFGDNTAFVLGRVSLNPVRHIDPFGTIIFPTLTLFLGGMLFGWAKPVPAELRFMQFQHTPFDVSPEQQPRAAAF